MKVAPDRWIACFEQLPDDADRTLEMKKHYFLQTAKLAAEKNVDDFKAILNMAPLSEASHANCIMQPKFDLTQGLKVEVVCNALLLPFLSRLVNDTRRCSDTGLCVLPEFVQTVLSWTMDGPDFEMPGVVKTAIGHVRTCLNFKDMVDIILPSPLPMKILEATRWMTKPLMVPLASSATAAPGTPAAAPGTPGAGSGPSGIGGSSSGKSAIEEEVRRWFVTVVKSDKTKDSEWSLLLARLQVPVMNYETSLVILEKCIFDHYV